MAPKEWIIQHFNTINIALVAFLVLMFLRKILQEDSKSQFKVRESERNLKFDRTGKDELGKATYPKKPEPLQLSGIRIDGQPHEILGIPAKATTDEIQKAYRELMKRYHPDLVGRPESSEWKDAQKIAEAINRARKQMLAKNDPKTAGKPGTKP